MIFFCDNNGTIIKNLPAPVYQGSAQTNNVYLIAPFAEDSTVTVAFTLSNGAKLGPFQMARENAINGVTDASGQTYSGFSYALPNSVTRYHGRTGMQFCFYAANGALTATSLTTFEVGRGVAPDLPEVPASDVYDDILANLAQIQGDLTSGTYVARSVFPWQYDTTYGTNEIVYYPYVGDYGAFVRSTREGNTDKVPYESGVLNSTWWEEVFNLDTVTAEYFGQVLAAVSAAQGHASSAEQSAQDAEQSAMSAEQSAQDAALTAAELEKYRDRILRFVEVLPEAGDENNLYAVVNAEDTAAFSLYAWENGWVPLGGVNITTTTTITYARTLYAAAWLEQAQSVTIDGMTDEDYVTVAPSDSAAAEYINAEMTVTQDGATLTFACVNLPSVDIPVTIAVTSFVDTKDAGGSYTKPEADAIFGANLTLDIDNDTFVVTAKLIARDGTVLAERNIDLPIESTVVGGEYDSATKSVILTLQSGETISVPVGDLVNGLATQSALNAEIAAREAADTTLQGNINTEAAARESADTALQSGIDDIVNGTTPVAKATNADAATRAQQDGNGRNIVSTYATKDELTSAGITIIPLTGESGTLTAEQLALVTANPASVAIAGDMKGSLICQLHDMWVGLQTTDVHYIGFHLSSEETDPPTFINVVTVVIYDVYLPSGEWYANKATLRVLPSYVNSSGKYLRATVNGIPEWSDPVPQPTSTDAGKVPVVNADGTGYELAEQSGGITNADTVSYATTLPTANDTSPCFVCITE